MVNREVTVYGYPADELIQFAKTCRACGIEPGEIKDFNEAVKKAFVVIQQETEREVKNAIDQAIDSAWRNGNIFKDKGEE